MTHVTISIRVEPELHERLVRLREERHVNVSAWTRDLMSEALDREFPARRERRRPEPTEPENPRPETTGATP